eukprot:TRINITY_DN9761_c0_g1_i2.p2 TRINITY_DN9761_c0_g1~~TRINITY_DN9761_c0_g1_i2.p2  ORF type:complete len:127 (-),score=32.50 TRINITY_DN9761_c0_g1_i2:110-490(-)
MKIALVHDMAEALCGDITPFQGVSKEEKHRLEEAAMAKIRDTVGNSIGAEIYELWCEYESISSREAQLVKDFDKFEMIVSASEYEQAQGVELQSFFDTVRGAFKTDLVRRWADELNRKRDQSRTST